MKKIIALTICVFSAMTATPLYAQTQSGNRILVAYFSWSGNARAIAGQIAEATGGDLFEIRTVTPYPENYDECTKIAKQEQDSNARPVLSERVANMAQYGTIFLCYPIWYGTLPMAVFTFLESYDFSGKTIYPLATHGGSRFGRSLDDIRKLSPKAVLGDGLNVSAFDRNPNDATRITIPNRDVTAWLRRLGVVR
jgi:flavodoxin